MGSVISGPVYRQTCLRWPGHFQRHIAIARRYAISHQERGDIPGNGRVSRKLLALDPKLDIELEAEAKRIYAPKLVEQGRILAEQ